VRIQVRSGPYAGPFPALNPAALPAAQQQQQLQHLQKHQQEPLLAVNVEVTNQHVVGLLTPTSASLLLQLSAQISALLAATTPPRPPSPPPQPNPACNPTSGVAPHQFQPQHGGCVLHKAAASTASSSFGMTPYMNVYTHITLTHANAYSCKYLHTHSQIHTGQPCGVDDKTPLMLAALRSPMQGLNCNSSSTGNSSSSRSAAPPSLPPRQHHVFDADPARGRFNSVVAEGG